MVHAHVTYPWLWLYFATVAVRSGQGFGFLHRMMALGIFASCFCGVTSNSSLTYAFGGVERQLKSDPASYLFRCFCHTVLLPTAVL